MSVFCAMKFMSAAVAYLIVTEHPKSLQTGATFVLHTSKGQVFVWSLIVKHVF